MKTHITIFSALLLAIDIARAQQPKPIEFLAKDAKITVVGQIHYEAAPEFQNIGGWNNTNAVVSWSLAELPKGNYRVFATFACDGLNAGSAVDIAIGTQRANFRVTSTGDWTTFKEEDLGPIIIRKTGPAEITARVTRIAKRWAVNIRSIKLVPEL